MLVDAPQPYLRWMVHILRRMLPGSPLTSNWLDHVAVNRTCEVNSLPRYFNLRPAVFEHTIVYLREREWRTDVALVLGLGDGLSHSAKP